MTATATSAPRTPALFLDRDGVINLDHGYVHEISRFDFIPGIFELARYAANTLRWPIIVVSNQAGIGRGYYDEAAFATLTQWMRQRFVEEGAPLGQVYHCSHHPVHGVGAYRADHPWRKPRPGMMLVAAAELGLDLAGSILVGDMPTDIEAGHAAGIGLLIKVDSQSVRTAAELRDPQPASIMFHKAANLAAVLRLVQQHALKADLSR